MGFPQGSISGPEGSKPAQEPLLRLREASPCKYITSGGREIASIGFVDDEQHYGAGAAHVPRIIEELRTASMLTAIGFAWDKSTAYASDWDEYCLTQAAHAAGVSSDAVRAAGWDVANGGERIASIVRIQHDFCEKLLGKRGSVANRHLQAAADLLDKIRSIHRLATLRRCSWEESSMLFQLVARGVLSYAPLVGIPRAADLHKEEACYHRLLLAGIPVRVTAERASLLVKREKGGLQAPSLVEGLVSAVAADLLLLLNGSSQASLVARDALRHAMYMDPRQSEVLSGTVINALRFLAGYGFFIAVGPDRIVSRILDHLFSINVGTAQSLAESYSEVAFGGAAAYCRVGFIANSVRLAARALRLSGVSPALWAFPGTWAPHIYHCSEISPERCAQAAQRALLDSSRDWDTELRLFARIQNANLSVEDWPDCAWDTPDAKEADPRSSYLDAVEPINMLHHDFALYSDGGGSAARHKLSSCCQARSFGLEGESFNQVHWYPQSLLPKCPAGMGMTSAQSTQRSFIISLLVSGGGGLDTGTYWLATGAPYSRLCIVFAMGPTINSPARPGPPWRRDLPASSES